LDVTPPPARVLRFGLFQLDTSTGELLRGGRRIRLQDQPLRVLTLLLERSGDLVTREELRRRLWPSNTFVDFDDGLNTAIRKLRSALGESSENPTFIETIPRRGYRFLASVTADHEGAARTVTDAVPAGPPRARRALWLGLAALAGLAAVAASIASRRSPPAAATGASPIRSIAVLPLKNLSADPEQQYFADGITEELITRLAALDGVRVISRTSAMRFRDSTKPLPAIAAELDVDAVIEGSVAHAGDRLRITAQLVRAADDRHLWAESFERDERDVLSLQDDVAREIARNVSATLRPRANASAPPIDPEAHRAFLRGRYRWHTRRHTELIPAVADFEKAIAREPAYALAYAGLADTWMVLPFLAPVAPQAAYPKAQAAAARALALDPSLPEAHNAHAYVKMYLDWDFEGAERSFRRAIELNPNYATAHQWYAELLSYQRRHDEALAHLRIALALDPLSAVMHHQAGQSLHQARRYDEAIEEYENAITLDPTFYSSYGAMAWAYVRQGKLKEAAAAFRRVVDGGGATAPPSRGERMAAAAEAGDGRAFRLLTLEQAEEHVRPACFRGPVLAALGRDDEALDQMEKALAQRADCVLYINVDPEWDHLRSHPRFVAALRRIGLDPVAVADAR
jgi:TolB-like protein/DNA-binding winged helix-turn-helix (wHTH) protein/tetratricopeptide (TPR) repeat protein